MSELRGNLYDFQKERIEALAVDALKRRGDQSFVILVLDLNDNLARDIAIAKSSEKEVRERMQAVNERGASACLLLDTTEHDADLFFESSRGWATLKSTLVRAGMVRVILVGDGGATFLTHKIPSTKY